MLKFNMPTWILLYFNIGSYHYMFIPQTGSMLCIPF